MTGSVYMQNHPSSLRMQSQLPQMSFVKTDEWVRRQILINVPYSLLVQEIVIASQRLIWTDFPEDGEDYKEQVGTDRIFGS